MKKGIRKYPTHNKKKCKHKLLNFFISIFHNPTQHKTIPASFHSAPFVMPISKDFFKEIKKNIKLEKKLSSFGLK